MAVECTSQRLVEKLVLQMLSFFDINNKPMRLPVARSSSANATLTIQQHICSVQLQDHPR